MSDRIPEAPAAPGDPIEVEERLDRRRFAADRGDVRKRVDRAVMRHLADRDDVSRTRVQGWVVAGRVRVNGRIVARPATRLGYGDLVEVALPPAGARPRPQPQPLGLDVIYQDESFLVVNKPAGLVVHPAHGHRDGTLFNALLWHARSWPESQRPSLVHRLDQHTSGLLLVARTRVVHARLARLLASREARKDYLAVVYGRLRRGRFDIGLRLQRDPADRRRVVVSNETGRPSLTRVERLACSSGPRRGLSLVRCRLLTGRMHQIRVHLAAIGHPLVGDAVYARPGVPLPAETALADACGRLGRQALHAWRLALPHPVSGRPLAFDAPLPDDLTALLRLAGLSVPTPGPWAR